MYRFKIFYFDSDYEIVYEDKVYAQTYGEALERAEINYKTNKWTFHYCEIEAERI